MLNSPVLKTNPDLYLFVPVIYTLWSDTVLTNAELIAMQELLSSQDWLKASDREFLLSNVDPINPPDPKELLKIFDDISTISATLPVNRKNGLAEIGVALAEANGGGSPKAVAAAQPAIRQMESALGLINHGAGFSLQLPGNKSITQDYITKQTFDPDTLNAILDSDQAYMIARVKSLLKTPEFRYLDTDNLDEYRAKVLSWCRNLAQHGYGSMAYPRPYGQDDLGKYFAIMETLSYHDLSLVIKFGVQFGLFGMSIFLLGTQKHHAKYLSSIGKLELPGCFAMTETNHGSNVKGIETTATYDHAKRSFTIHTPHALAQKEYIGNAALHGQAATVFAKLIINDKDYGVGAWVVPLRDAESNVLPGITIEDCGRKMGLNGVDNGKITFNHVVVPYENMLDRFASVNDAGEFQSPIANDNRRFFTMLGTLVGGRIGIPRAGLSATKSGLTIAIRYGDKRRQFGPDGAQEVPILNYRTHQRRLMPLLANAYALHFALQYLTDRFIARKDDEMQEIEALAAGLKAFTTWNATESLQECRECCGGKGYLAENRISALKNDTDVFTTFEGDNTVLMQLVAKGRLSDFRHEFGHMNVFGMINYVAHQAATSVTEMNPVIIRSTDEKHLMDTEFHLNAFKYRERHILTSAARRLKRLIDDGMDSFDAFNVSQHHLIQVGFAYVERVVLEQFIRKIESTNDDGCKAVLKKLCALFALSQIEKNRGWYLEQGYMEGVKTKAIRKQVNQLCWEIRQEAVPLVNSFGIPDELLSAPIATA